MLARTIERLVIARIRMTPHARGRIVPQHPLEPLGGLRRAIGTDHHTGVLAEPHADAAAMVQADPGRPRGGVHQRIEQRPVAHRVRAVHHRFCLAVGRGDRTAVEMVAPDHHRRLELAARHHFIKGETRAMPIAKPDPADPRRQALERDPLLRHVEPIVQMGVLREKLLHLGIGLADILRIARQRRPAERPHTPAEQRPDIGRHKAREGKGILEPLFEGHLTDVVAIIDGRHAILVEGHHRRHMGFHAGPRGLFDLLRGALALFLPLRHGPALRQIAIDRVMRRGLIGHDIGTHAALVDLGENIRRIAQKRHGFRLARLSPTRDHLERLIETVGLLVHVSRAQTEIDAVGVALHRQTAGPRHHRSQRLRAAHAAQTPGEDPLAGEAAVVMLTPGFGKGLIGALHDALTADVDPRPGRHLAVHHQALLIELVEMIPIRPMRHQVRVGDKNARRIGMGAHDGHRLARLHDEGLIRLQRLEAVDDQIEILPGPRRPANAAINDKLMRVLGHIGMQVVHHHPHRRLGEPALRGDLGPGRGIDVTGVLAGISHGQSP